MKIAVIIPIYNEADAIALHFEEIRQQLKKDGLDAHFVLVDDGSKDGSWNVLMQIAGSRPNVKLVKFSRNFGKEMAIRAGLSRADADCYVVMDSDLQHPPRHIVHMIRMLEENNVDIVNGKKSSRGKESPIYKIFAHSFYHLMHSMSGVDMQGDSDFKVLRKTVVDALLSFREQGGFFRGFVSWVGFSSADYYFDVEERKAGTTSFSFRRLVKLAINAIVGHSAKPLNITIYMGLIFLVFSIILGIQTLFNFFSGNAISGFSTVILLQLIIGSFVLICLGLIGIYIAKIYDEVKRRPPFLIEAEVEETPENDVPPSAS